MHREAETRVSQRDDISLHYVISHAVICCKITHLKASALAAEVLKHDLTLCKSKRIWYLFVTTDVPVQILGGVTTARERNRALF